MLLLTLFRISSLLLVCSTSLANPVGHIIQVEVNGNYNNVLIDQTGTGNHYVNLSISGNNHSAEITQAGLGGHVATVQLDGTQPWNFTLSQTGITSQLYDLGSNVSGTCLAIGGCNLAVTQQ